MQDKLLSTKELSEYLGIAVSTIIEYRMNNSGWACDLFFISWLKKGKILIIIKHICSKIKTAFQ